MAKTVKIKSGQTLSGIAKANNTTVSALAKANNISNVNLIRVGATLTIPGSSGSSKTTNTSSKSTGTLSGGMSVKPTTTSRTTPSRSLSGGMSIKPTPKATPKTTVKGTNNIFTKAKDFFTDAINIGAKSQTATSLNAFDYTKSKQNPVITQNFSKSAAVPIGAAPTFGEKAMKFADTFETKGNQFIDAEAKYFENIANKGKAQYPNQSSTPASSSSPSITPDTFNPITSDGDIQTAQSNPEISGGGTGSKETITKTYTNPQTGDTTTKTMEIAGTKPVAPVNYTGINGANNAIMGINADIKALQGQGNVWESDNGKSLINNRITSWTDDIAKHFKTVSDFENSYNSNPNFAANVNGLASIGLTPETIKAKIEAKTTTAINGILPPQTTAEYLDSMVDNLAGIPKINTGDKTMDANLREQALLERGYTKEYIDMLKGDHDTVGLLERDKIEADQAIENLNEKIENKEESIRDKADYLIDKAKYEFDKADAELEINRLNAKNYAIGFLAQIGALSTSSAAMEGILNLDQKYQAQRQDLRNNYQMSVREIKMNMNDQINTLEENRDDNILKINSDLSKSEREVALEIMKLTYQTNKSMLEIKTKADEALQAKKEKAAAKAAQNESDYFKQFFTTSGYDVFLNASPEYRRAWEEGSTSWLTPAYKGQITPEQVLKSRAEYTASKENAAVTLTPTKKTAAISWLVNNSAPQWVIDGVKNGDENAILTTLRLMEENK